MKLINYTLQATALLCMYTAQAANSTNLIEVTSEDQYQTILAEKKLLVLEFYAPWCGACKNAKPHVEKLTQEYPTITILKLNGDTFRTLIEQYKVSAYPTFIVLDATGKAVDRVVGGNMDKLRRTIMRNCANP